MTSIEDLPRELLINIAASLSYEDILNCMRLNKYFHETIQANRHKLAKPTIRCFHLQRESNRISIHVNKKYRREDWKMKLAYCIAPTKSKPDRKSEVADLYIRKAVGDMDWNKQTYYCRSSGVLTVTVPDLMEALEDHLEFVLATTEVKMLALKSEEPEDYQLLKSVINRTSTTIQGINANIMESNVTTIKQIIHKTGLTSGIFKFYDQTSAESLLSDSNLHKFEDLEILKSVVDLKIFDILNYVPSATNIYLWDTYDFCQDVFVQLVQELINGTRKIEEIAICVDYGHNGRLSVYERLARERFHAYPHPDRTYSIGALTHPFSRTIEVQRNSVYIIPANEQKYIEVIESIKGFNSDRVMNFSVHNVAPPPPLPEVSSDDEDDNPLVQALFHHFHDSDEDLRNEGIDPEHGELYDMEWD